MGSLKQAGMFFPTSVVKVSKHFFRLVALRGSLVCKSVEANADIGRLHRAVHARR